MSFQIAKQTRADITGIMGNGVAAFVITDFDLDRLAEVVGDVDLTEAGHPEVFFRFENYPEVVAFATIAQAAHTLENARNFYHNFPGTKFWLTLNKNGEEDQSL